MRTPASAVHYGSMVLHNFLATAHSPKLHSRARCLLDRPEKAATFGRRVVNEAQLRARSINRHELCELLAAPI